MKILFLVALSLILLLSIPLYEYWEEHKLKQKSISAPPVPPAVTPTISVEGVELGDYNYFKNENPEEIISVIAVQNGYVTFEDDYNTGTTTLLVSDFLADYTKRTVEKISNL